MALCGAAGFVGRAMLEALLAAGFRVKALDLSEDSWTATDAHGRTRMESGLPTESDSLELIYGNIADHAVVEALLHGCAAVVHTTVFFPQQVAGVHEGTVLPDQVDAHAIHFYYPTLPLQTQGRYPWVCTGLGVPHLGLVLPHCWLVLCVCVCVCAVHVDYGRPLHPCLMASASS